MWNKKIKVYMIKGSIDWCKYIFFSSCRCWNNQAIINIRIGRNNCYFYYFCFIFHNRIYSMYYNVPVKYILDNKETTQHKLQCLLLDQRFTINIFFLYNFLSTSNFWTSMIIFMYLFKFHLNPMSLGLTKTYVHKIIIVD